MNEANQGSNSNIPGNFPAKRRRGRPRKDQSKRSGDNARIASRFEGVNTNLPLQVEPINVANDAMVGQVVSGVVDASFDAGYLLTVRVGNSDTILRGVVFKPGRYVPVSLENDVAPHVQMIQRNEIHQPARNEHHGNFQGNEIAYPWNGSSPANHVPTANVKVSKGNKVQKVVSQIVAHPVGESGTLVPVALQPASQSNKAPPTNLVSPPDIQAAAKDKEVMVAAVQGPHSSNGSTSNLQISGVTNIVKNEDHFHQAPMELVCDAECRSMQMPSIPFETLLDEVVKRSQVASHSGEGQVQEIQGSGLNLDEGHEKDQAFTIKSAQDVQQNHHHSPAVPPHLDNTSSSEMTQLLQVPGVQDANSSFGHHFDKPRKQEEASGDSPK